MTQPEALEKFNPQWFNINPRFDRTGFLDYSYEGKFYKLWYGIVGNGSEPPLLVQHGGPGIDHIYLISLQALAFERPVIFYDQLGCGLSSRPDDPALWTMERAVEEAKFVRDSLGLKEFHLYGSSYGTLLASSFAIAHPEGIISLTLSSPFLDLPYYSKHAVPAIKATLPPEVVKIIDDFELYGRGSPDEYNRASMVYLESYYCLAHPFPPPMEHIMDNFNPQIMSTMWGGDLNVTGNLKNFDVTKELGNLRMPVFMHCGRHDFSRPEELEYYHSFVPSAHTHIFENSAHLAMIDAPLEYMQVMRKMLVKMEGK